MYIIVFIILALMVAWFFYKAINFYFKIPSISQVPKTPELLKPIENPKTQSPQLSPLVDYAVKLFEEKIKTRLEKNPGILQKTLSKEGIDTSVCNTLEKYGYIIRKKKSGSFALYLSDGTNLGVYTSSNVRIRLRERISCEIYPDSKKMIIDYFGLDFLKRFLQKEHEYVMKNNPDKAKEWKKSKYFGRPDSCLYDDNEDNFITRSALEKMGECLTFDMNGPLTQLVNKYWTKQCDEVLKIFYETYGFFAAESFINLVLPKIIDEDRLISFYKELKERASSFHIKRVSLSGYIKNIPSDYILLCYANHLRFKWNMKPEIIERRCLYCGEQFFPTSHYYSFTVIGEVAKCYPIKKPISEINFCSKHFPPKLFRMVEFEKSVKGRDNKSIKEKMISLLKELSDILGFIPPQDFHSIMYLMDLPKEKFEQAIICINKMPPYENKNAPVVGYKTVFGPWLLALDAAGLLEGGVRKTKWGYLCIAKDGHLCRSLGEKIVDDYLYTNGIPHEKEPQYPGEKSFRADWKTGPYLIEFWGLKGQEDYDNKIEKKRIIAAENSIPLIEITFSDLRKLNEKFKELFKE